jgi:hypothetical protein
MLLAELNQYYMTPPLDRSMCSSDHPIRPRQHLRWNRQADLLRGFEIDHQLEFCGPLYRQVGRHSAFQNFVCSRGPPLRTSAHRHLRILW